MLGFMQLKDKGNRIYKWVCENYFKVLITVNSVLLLIFILCYVNKISNLTELEFSEQQIGDFIEGNSIGGFIDKDSEVGLYDIIPDMFLKKGYYSYTVYYEGDSPGSFCWPHTYVEAYDVIEQQTVSLGEEKNSGTKRFWLNADLNIALRLFYNGEGSISFNGFSIRETNILANIELFSSILLLLGANIVFYIAANPKKRAIDNCVVYTILALVVITVVASSLSLAGSIMEGHDTRFHLARIEGIKEGILAGQFPVRISPVFYNGYGYANSIFYGELFLYFPACLRLIGFSVIDSYNSYLIALNFFTVLICFYVGKKMFFSNAIAVTMAALFTLSPYRLMDMYTRSAIGEVTAMAFLPLIVYGVYRILTEDCQKRSYKRAYIPLMLGMTGIIQSHVLTVEMAAGFIGMACILFCFKTLQGKRFLMLLKAACITILVNLWFLVPFVDFMMTQDVRVFEEQGIDMIQKTGLFFPQLFSLFSDYSQMSLNASSGLVNEMTYSIGLPVGLGIVLCVAMLVAKKENDDCKVMKMQSACILLLTVIAIWMTTVAFPWDRFSTMWAIAAKLITSLQFVWRFVGIASALAVVCVGFGLLLLEKQEGKNIASLAMSVFLVLALVSAMDFVQDKYFNRDKADITENSLLYEDNAYYAMNGEYNLKDQRYEVVTECLEPRCFAEVSITAYKKQGTSISFVVENSGEDGYVYLPLLNYKGYKVSSKDGVITSKNLHMGEHAVVRIDIPQNYSGEISISYAGFWYWRVAELITLASVVGLLWHFRSERRKKMSD